MELDWNFYINFPEDIEDTFTPFFNENVENIEVTKNVKGAKDVENILEDIIIPPNNNSFIELEVQPILEPFTNNTNTSDCLINDTNTSNCLTYQYNLHIGDNFDDWEFVNRFMHEYCLEKGFGYQIY